MLPVVEMFYSIQGEGLFTGIPSVFLRVSGCNLRCVFKDSICDTPYTSFNPEKSKYNSNEEILDDLVKLFLEHKYLDHLVITGGEPLLYRKELEEFLQKFLDMFPDTTITIETNGTLPPLNSELVNVSLYSISPKLSTSVDHDLKKLNKEQADRHNNTRINIDSLYEFISSEDCVFKFVYSGPECIDEIKSIYSKLIEKSLEETLELVKETSNDNQTIKEYDQYEQNTVDHITNILSKMTYLMPEGMTREQLEKSRLDTVEACLKEGWIFTDRTHINIWGDKRGV